jgi:Asp-tRNA(Asn)/Glu-tRNA(Gln) amidotransferase A subunit family amidase
MKFIHSRVDSCCSSPQVKCISEILFSQALARAAELDDYLRAHGKPIGPLHGLPISLKDQFRVKDAETSVGYVAWLGKKETDETESFLVKRLKALGAIVYVKTNVPTSLMVSFLKVGDGGEHTCANCSNRPSRPTTTS